MANLCSINILIPLDKVPDQKEREQLTALYKAQKKWEEAVKTNEELRKGKNHSVFIASQPGVPFEKTQWNTSGGHFRGRSGEVLKPDSEQWNHPIISASFKELEGRVWVHPYSFGRGEGLLFDVNDGITIKRPDNVFSSPYIPMQWEFKWSFPWWAQIGFAGAKKHCDQVGEDAPEGQTEEFYKKWYEEHGQPSAITYLTWEQPVSKIVGNLEYAIKVYENFPVIGEAWKWGWVYKELNQLSKIYPWFKKIHKYIPEAITYLDWSEVAWNCMTYEEARKDDQPNQIMNVVKAMDADVKKLTGGELDSIAFQEKYTTHIKKDGKDYQGYTSITERDPFDEI